jgi:Protein of unknown function (DUF3341)
VSTIYGLYSDPADAQYAVDQLRKAGIADGAITVIAAQPYEEYEFSHRYKETWIFWIAAGGGFLGLSVGLALAYITEALWPIVTGGMPIVAWWPNIIILFELTMLGAILATVVSLLITAGLPSTRAKVYDPAVSLGKILVAVEGPADARTVESTLRATPVDEIKRH